MPLDNKYIAKKYIKKKSLNSFAKYELPNIINEYNSIII